MAYVAIKNFKEGDKIKGWKQYFIGQDYNGSNAPELMKAGIVADKAKSMEAQAASLMLELHKKESELKHLQDRINALQNPVNSKLVAPQAPAPAPKHEGK